MPKFKISTVAALGVLLLAGCGGGEGEVAFSQQRAISADMDASFQHGPSTDDHSLGIQFNDNLDATINNRTPPLGAALGFR